MPFRALPSPSPWHHWYTTGPIWPCPSDIGSAGGSCTHTVHVLSVATPAVGLRRHDGGSGRTFTCETGSSQQPPSRPGMLRILPANGAAAPSAFTTINELVQVGFEPRPTRQGQPHTSVHPESNGSNSLGDGLSPSTAAAFAPNAAVPKFGGGEGDRTPALQTASLTLSQLSYTPKFCFCINERPIEWIALLPCRPLPLFRMP